MSQGFSEYVVDCFSPFGDITSRRMFGGYGIYKDSVIIAIIADDELYMKVDDATEKTYKALDSQPFTYEKKGKPYQMRYWKLPVDILEDRERLAPFIADAYAVSLASKKT